MKKAVHTSVIVALLGGISVALLGDLVAAPVLRLLQVPQEAFSAALLCYHPSKCFGKVAHQIAD